ncbi:MAG: hypothetical protein RL077_5650 [Verrucomicrobiota bacterium]|jgi:TPR repeat protein
MLQRIFKCLLSFGLLASAIFAADLAETRKKAEQGGATAPFNIGWMYDKGDGVPKDSTAAVNCYRKAAEQDDASGQRNSARLLNPSEQGRFLESPLPKTSFGPDGKQPWLFLETNVTL